MRPNDRPATHRPRRDGSSGCSSRSAKSRPSPGWRQGEPTGPDRTTGTGRWRRSSPTPAINLPFELIRPPGRGFVGLTRVLARVHGLAELTQVLDRRPGPVPASGNDKAPAALVVGDPGHPGVPRLPGARAMARTLAEGL